MSTISKKLYHAAGLSPGKSFDNHSLLFLVISGIILVAAGAVELYLRQPQFSWVFFLIGFPLFVIGTIVRMAGQNNLDKQFTIAVKIVDNHELITDGIHSYIRHPMYTGMFLMLIGLCLALQSFAGILVTILLVIPAGVYRVYVEEKVLLKFFGKKYSDYMKKTKRFLPYLF